MNYISGMEMRNETVVRKSHGNSQLERYRRRWKSNIKVET